MLKSEPTTKEESKEPVNAEKISPFDSVSFLENHGLFSQEFATALRGSLGKTREELLLLTKDKGNLLSNLSSSIPTLIAGIEGASVGVRKKPSDPSWAWGSDNVKKNAAIAILVNHAVKELVTNRGISTEEIRRMIETHRFVGNTKTILKHFRASIPESLFGKVEVAVKHMEAYTKRCEDSLLTKSPEKVSKGSIASAILAEFVREVGRATEKFQVDTIRNHRFLTNHYELKTSLIPLSSTYDLIKIFDFMKDQEGKKEMIPTFRIDMTSHDAYVYIPGLYPNAHGKATMEKAIIRAGEKSGIGFVIEKNVLFSGGGYVVLSDLPKNADENSVKYLLSNITEEVYASCPKSDTSKRWVDGGNDTKKAKESLDMAYEEHPFLSFNFDTSRKPNIIGHTLEDIFPKVNKNALEDVIARSGENLGSFVNTSHGLLLSDEEFSGLLPLFIPDSFFSLASVKKLLEEKGEKMEDGTIKPATKPKNFGDLVKMSDPKTLESIFKESIELHSAVTSKGLFGKHPHLAYFVRKFSPAKGFGPKDPSILTNITFADTTDISMTKERIKSAFERGNIVFFDTESTGVEQSVEFPLQISAVGGDGKTIFNKKIKSNIHSFPGAFLVHGIDGSVGEPFTKEMAEEISEFLKGKIVFAHNANFDVAMLANAFASVGKNDFPKCLVFDTLGYFRKNVNADSYKLGQLASKFVEKEKFSAHDSLEDVKMLRATLKNFIES